MRLRHHLGALVAMIGAAAPNVDRIQTYYDPGKQPRPRRGIGARFATQPFRKGRKNARAKLCALHGVPNTGRQWTMLRKKLKRLIALSDAVEAAR